MEMKPGIARLSVFRPHVFACTVGLLFNFTSALGQAPQSARNPEVRLSWKFDQVRTEGRGLDKVEYYRHKIEVVNLTSAQIESIDVRLRIYGHNEFGPDGKPEDEVHPTDYELKLAKIEGRAKQTVATEPGNYALGDNVRPKDTISGVWIKAFSNGREIGSYVQPASLAKKEVWNPVVAPPVKSAEPVPPTPPVKDRQ